MMNPHNSPWLKPAKPAYIDDVWLYSKWQQILKHLANSHTYAQVQHGLLIDKQFIIAKRSSKFRLCSQLDWAHYRAKDLAQAMNQSTVDQYYEQQLTSLRSDPNIWNDLQKEMELKTFYAARAGRASKI